MPQKAEDDFLNCISDVIGDLKDKNILDQTGDIKPLKKTPTKAKVIKKPWEEAKAAQRKKTPKDKIKKVSQWEIREQLAQKKRENIYAEVKRKKVREAELLKRDLIK